MTGVVDQDALIVALKTGQIAAAGLDVMTPEPLPVDHELTRLKNCGSQTSVYFINLSAFKIVNVNKLFNLIAVLIPHIGSATLQTRTAMATMTALNIVNALEGKAMPAQLC